ncbi:MAG: DUF983 domain-containing protein [Verrucomicrobia bacterium]|nr:DUF983 domain-containing protein [Verrucomicrobiota bacterium]
MRESRRAAPPEPRTLRLALTYLWRAMRLRCPVCGQSRIFIPLLRTRSIMDWLTPLDGCPRCGYPYEREPGYFLFSLWVLNFGFVAMTGLLSYLWLELFADVSTPVLIASVALPAPVLGLAIARHAKALFIALDHFFDPFVPIDWPEDSGDDDGGDQRPERPGQGGGGTGVKLPEPEPAGAR